MINAFLTHQKLSQDELKVVPTCKPRAAIFLLPFLQLHLVIPERIQHSFKVCVTINSLL